MKKVFMTLMIFVILLCIIGNLKVQAATQIPDIEFDITSTIVDTENEKAVKIILSFGEFTEISENAIIGYEAVLEYDENIFENVTVKGLNGWTATYADSTKRIVGDPFTGKENSEITEISLNIKENATIGLTTIKLNNILISADDNNDFTYNKEIIVEIEKAETEPDNTVIEDSENNQTEKVEENNQEEEKIEITATSGKEIDKTISTEKLPDAGARVIVYIISIVIFIGAISFIRYKSIVTK